VRTNVVSCPQQKNIKTVDIIDMNGKWTFLTGCMIVLMHVSSLAQPDWQLKQDKDGIQVYTKNIDNAKLKAVKVVTSISTSLTTLTAVLMDVDGSKDWVYATKKISLLKQVSPASLIYYSEIEIPWPGSNRDFIVEIQASQDEKTKVVTVDGFNKPDYLPENNNMVRIRQSYSKWLITPLQKGQVKIEYVLQVDPGGNIPIWLINLFATKGPLETFKKLREQVKKKKYAYISLPYIKE
jgi:hypothetical protein